MVSSELLSDSPNARVLTASSREAINSLIDGLIESGKDFTPLVLVRYPVGYSHLHEYKGLFIRVWTHGGKTRYDAAYDT